MQKEGNTMERIPVESSNIESIGYQADMQMLEVEFKGHSGKPNSVYAYDGVPPEIWQQFLASPSKGRFFQESIRGKYKTTKISG
jgi:hypothetical protein